MGYTIKWHPKVRKYLRKLHKDISSRIVRKVKQIQNNPFHYLEHYEGEKYYKLRIGEYRALIDIEFENKILCVQVVGHRKDIYKNVE
tara:strand:- start:606 stop:866 length:261 start_codon:yes stop_codon:yes gene_type:complete